jgi:hypothetical protein
MFVTRRVAATHKLLTSELHNNEANRELVWRRLERADEKIFPSLRVHTGSEDHSALSLGVRRPERNTEHSLRCSVEVKNE